ncbi:ETS homologous factor-like, partial [Amphibalanus amphitrite]
QPKIGKLWQFLLALLHDKSHNPSMIKWDDFEQGRFKFVQSEAVARLWGSRKGYETNMTYEKLSRAMRYYYKPGILEPVVGRRLVYAFGPNADWKTPPDVSLV